MVNPPTFNDLKRARNLYNSQQRKKILLGSSIPLKFGTPSLTVPNFTFNFLSIDNNYVATGDELGASDVDQLDFFIQSKFIDYPTFEFYNKHRFITSTDYLFDSLYFLNDKFRQKSINFNDTIDDVGEISFDRKFYNYDSEIETQSVILTSYDFSNLQVNLSTDVVGFTGDNDTTSFNIDLNPVIENGRLLEDFVDYNISDNFNLSSISFDNLSAIKNSVFAPVTIPYKVLIDDITGNTNFTITLSTIRNDGNEGVNASFNTFNIDVSAAPYAESLANSIHTVWTTVSSLSNPLDEYPTLSGLYLEDNLTSFNTMRDGVNKLFFFQSEYFRPDANLQSHITGALDNASNEAIRSKYRYLNNRTTNYATYNEDWFLYPYRHIYDLSGVTLRKDNNITLINGKFGISATHFGGRGVGSSVKFLTTENIIISTTVDSTLNLGLDMKLYKLSDDVTALAALTAGDIKTYKVPLFTNFVKRSASNDISKDGRKLSSVYPMLVTGGNYNLGKLRNVDFSLPGDIFSSTGANYNEGDEHAALGTSTRLAFNAPLSGSGAGASITYTGLQSVSSIFENKKLGLPQGGVATGDSSSPQFIIANNELLFLTMPTSNSVETKQMHDRITDGMNALGREGFELSAVQLD